MTSENISNEKKRPEVISNQMFYKEVDEVAPRYKYVKINMSNIMGNAVAVTPTGSTQVQFKLPYNTVFNLAKSKISCLFPLADQGNGNYSQLVADCFPFGNGLVTFETGNGLQMLNLQESAKYTKILSKINTKMSDFLGIDVTNNPHPCNVGTAAANSTGLGTAGSNIVYEPQYYDTSPIGNGTTGGNNNVPLYYELGMFSNTILGLDKDLYFGQNDIFLKITVQGTNYFAYKTTGALPSTGPVTLSAPLATLQNVYLWLAVEVNPVCINQLHKAFESGALSVLIDYPIITKTTTQATTNQAIVIPFLPAMGHTLKKVIHTVWNSAETLATALDCENSATQSKVQLYNTYLDSTKLQDDQIACATANTNTNIYEDDWRINQPFCRDSVISSYPIYQKNWFHCDDFTSPDMLKNPGVTAQQNTLTGLAMSRGIQWQFIANTTQASYIHNNFAIFQRTLQISPNGVMFI